MTGIHKPGTATNMNKSHRSSKYKEASRMYNSGMSLRDVALFYGKSPQAIWDVLKRRGVQMRPVIRRKQESSLFRGGHTSGAVKAKNMTRKAIERGVLVRPQRCQTCQGPGVPYPNGQASIQAHHCDYNKPLDVMWLCQKCHHEWHRKNRPIPMEK